MTNEEKREILKKLEVGTTFSGVDVICRQYKEIERLNNIINRTTKYVQNLSSKGRGCDIYEDIKQEILKELKGSGKEWKNYH